MSRGLRGGALTAELRGQEHADGGLREVKVERPLVLFGRLQAKNGEVGEAIVEPKVEVDEEGHLQRVSSAKPGRDGVVMDRQVEEQQTAGMAAATILWRQRGMGKSNST